MNDDRAKLTAAQFRALREAVLRGMQAYALEEPVTSRRSKALRGAWSALAPYHAKKFFVIEIDNQEIADD
jgi:hypothetical protein